MAGLVLLAGVAVALVVALATRNDGDRVSADPSSPPSAVPTPSSSEPGPEQSSSSAPSSPTESAGDRTDELLAVLPPDFADCTGTDLAGDGDVAAVTCGPGATQPGPQGAEFYLYDDTSTLDRVFVEDVEDAGIEEMPAGEDCSTAQGVTTWNGADDTEGGTVACAITDEGLLIAWTDREFGVEGVVTAPGSTQEELAELAAWWRTNSDFQR